MVDSCHEEAKIGLEVRKSFLDVLPIILARAYTGLIYPESLLRSWSFDLFQEASR